MRVAFCADLHLANHRKWGTPIAGAVAPVNTRARDILSVVSAARRRAEEEGCTDLFVLGDVFDTTHPEPQLVAELSMALATTGDLTTHIMVGNHDRVSDQRGDHAVISMDGMRNLRVYDTPELVYVEDGTVCLIPYQPGNARKYLPGVMEATAGQYVRARGPVDVLALHLGLITDRTEPWLLNAHDAFPASEIPKAAFKLTVAGNWHGRFEVAPNVWQCGALVPTGFDNPGWTGYGSLIVWDGKRAKAIEMNGPRFIKAIGLAELRKELDRVADATTGYPLYLKAVVKHDELADARELFELHDHGLYELSTDKGAVEASTRSAAEAAASVSSSGIRAAVTAYVAKMSLPEGVSRPEVLALALDYASGGAT